MAWARAEERRKTCEEKAAEWEVMLEETQDELDELHDVVRLQVNVASCALHLSVSVCMCASIYLHLGTLHLSRFGCAPLSLTLCLPVYLFDLALACIVDLYGCATGSARY